MGKPLSEEIKVGISDQYKTSDQSMGAIAQALGVSERTVRRYKNYDSLGRPRPDNNGKARPPSPEASPMTRPHGQAIEETERPSQNEADQALDSTDRTRPDASHVDEEPKGITFIGGKKKHKEPEPVEEEEFEYKCEKCGAEFNMLNHGKCPNCGVKLDLENYAKLTGNSDEKEEFEYECPHCHYEFNSRSDTCPSCGGSLFGYDD
jgi:DNA-directed RNA polymerase subunit RPC12/RpoP/transposase-like protein